MLALTMALALTVSLTLEGVLEDRHAWRQLCIENQMVVCKSATTKNWGGRVYSTVPTKQQNERDEKRTRRAILREDLIELGVFEKRP